LINVNFAKDIRNSDGCACGQKYVSRRVREKNQHREISLARNTVRDVTDIKTLEPAGTLESSVDAS
jgi:hypothetical protein